jgi:hypothetical protein
MRVFYGISSRIGTVLMRESGICSARMVISRDVLWRTTIYKSGGIVSYLMGILGMKHKTGCNGYMGGIFQRITDLKDCKN